MSHGHTLPGGSASRPMVGGHYLRYTVPGSRPTFLSKSMFRCGGPRIGRAQIRQEFAESGNATVTCMDSALLIT